MNYSHFENSKVLITGGLGFIGANLAIRLVGLGARVTLVDSVIPQYGGNVRNIEPVRNQVQVSITDIRDPHGMAHLVRGQDYLFNLAGQTSHLDSMEDPNTDLEINCRAQLTLLETCRRNNPSIRIVFASTRQIYGRPKFLPVTEDHPICPVDVNGINKAAGEEYHLLYSHVHGLRASALRLTNTIGPRMRIKDARQTFVGDWIRRCLTGEAFEVWSGNQLRDFTYVDDAVAAFLLAVTVPESVGQVFNLGGTEVVSLSDLAVQMTKVCPTCKYQVRSFPAERKLIDIGDFYADYSKAKKVLGWTPTTSLAVSLERTMEFFRTELSHYL